MILFFALHSSSVTTNVVAEPGAACHKCACGHSQRRLGKKALQFTQSEHSGSAESFITCPAFHCDLASVLCTRGTKLELTGSLAQHGNTRSSKHHGTSSQQWACAQKMNNQGKGALQARKLGQNSQISAQACVYSPAHFLRCPGARAKDPRTGEATGRGTGAECPLEVRWFCLHPAVQLGTGLLCMMAGVPVVLA